MRLWPKCLTYGNWGAPGWSGGKWCDDPSEVDWFVPSIDDMDEAFKWHDRRVQSGFGRLAHQLCAMELERGEAPDGLWPKMYRYGAIGIFTVMGWGA